MPINGNITDELNGIIASRNSLRGTMKGAGVAGVTDTTKLDALAAALQSSVFAPPAIVLNGSQQVLSTKGKLLNNNIIIPPVRTCFVSENLPAASDGENNDIWLFVPPTP